MSTSMDQVARLLAEIPYIEAHPGVTLAEVSEVFSISQAQVRKDVAVAVFCGLPGGYPGDLIDIDFEVLDDEGALYLHNPTSLDRPLRLTATEAAGLQLALMAVRELVPTPTVEIIDALMTKIAIPATQCVELRLATGNEQVRQEINHGIANSERMQLTYHGWVKGSTTHPIVDPASIYVSNGVVYLSAYDVKINQWRTYRLENISAVKPTGEDAIHHGRPPGSDTWGELLAASPVVRLVVKPSAGWVGEYYPSTKVVNSKDSVEIWLPVADPQWLVRLVMSLGEAVITVEPSHYLKPAVDLAAATLVAYDQAW